MPPVVVTVTVRIFAISSVVYNDIAERRDSEAVLDFVREVYLQGMEGELLDRDHTLI